MVNRHRGEIQAKMDDKFWTLCLTLGALAELESAFEVANIAALADKFSGEKLSANDLVKVIGAGLRGAGHPLKDDEVKDMQIEGGALGYAKLASELLELTFSASEPGTA